MLKLTNLRRAHRASILALAVMSLGAFSAHATSITFEIEPQDLSGALKSFAVQSHREIFFAPELARGRKSNGVKGTFDELKALDIILEGTGLNFTVTSSNAILVRDSTNRSGSLREGGTPTTLTIAGADNSSIRMAQAGSAQDQGVGAVGSNSAQPVAAGEPRLQEVIVTAQKREERLQDVPVPVTALNASALAESEQTRIDDYYTQVPGLTVSTDGYQSSLSTVAIRGITTGGFGYPTVGISYDDVPIGSATTYGGGVFAPDLDPSDLARIEVLRGPQGTLYGANSMGGLIKYVTVDPSVDGLSGRIQAGATGVYNGNQAGYNFRGAVNVPLGDELAFRASAFTRQDPGYIDNVESGQNALNEARVSGGRLAALWRPSENFSLKVSALYQDSKTDGYSFVDLGTGLGDLEQKYLRGTGESDYKRQIYTATLHAELGGIDLASVSGYSVQKSTGTYDDSLYAAYYNAPMYGVTAASATSNYKYSKATQELRLSSAVGKQFDWLVGLFYTYENNKALQQVYAADATSGDYAGWLAAFNFPSTYQEFAGFMDLTYHVTDQFDVQIGGRESGNRQTYQETDMGYYVDGTCPDNTCVNPTRHSNDNSFTYLVTPRYRITPDWMLYARVASGYRPGGPNTTGAPGIPAQFGPDKTNNYELGTKAEFLDHTLSLDASVYYIEWKNLQLSLTSPNGFGYFANGSAAKSQGVELSAELRPFIGTHISAWVAYDDAVLTQNLPQDAAVIAASGDRLPNSSRFSGNISLKQEFPLTATVKAFVGATESYVGDRLGVFLPTYITAPRATYPAYAKTDALAGLNVDSWSVNLFINNLTDRRGILAGGVGTGIDPNGFILIQPRNFGMSVVKEF